MAKVLAFLLLVAGTAGQSIIEGPENTAAPLSESTLLNCRVDLGADFVEWRSYLTGANDGERIWSSYFPDNEVDPRFKIHQDGDSYNLELVSMELDMAGKYVCRIQTANIGAEAEVIAISPAKCDPELHDPPFPPNPPEIEEGATMMFLCDVSYNGTVQPIIEWFTHNGLVPSFEIYDNETNLLRSTANVTATPDGDWLVHECHVRFESEDGLIMAPNYADNCSTYFEVLHAVSEVELSPDPEDFPGGVVPVNIGDRLNCSANGRPFPDYHWYERETLRPGPEGSPVLTIEADMEGEQEWVCRATNTIKGQSRSMENNITFLLEGGNGPGNGEEGAVEGWVIAVAVVVPLLVIIALIMVGAFLFMRNRPSAPQKKPSGPGFDNRGSAPDEPGPPARASVPGQRPPSQPVPGPSGPRVSGQPDPGAPVLPMTQQGYPGKASPGYADLGVKHISGSAASLTTSRDSLPRGSLYMGDEGPQQQQQQQQQRPASYNNPGFQTTARPVSGISGNTVV